MNRVIKLGNAQEARVFHGGRSAGQQLRMEIEDFLNANDYITLDFSGVGVVTQSYIDEAIGVLVLEYGQNILSRLAFKNCNEDVAAVIRYVASTRAEDFQSKQTVLIH